MSPSTRPLLSRALVRAVALVLLVAGPGLAVDAGTAAARPVGHPRVGTVPAPAVPKINWQSCGADLAAFQCATVAVPTDYRRPTGATTRIALTRLPAAKPSIRIGSLFVNPGGPGGSGVDFVQQNALTAYPQAVRDRFDIVGFDPRGTNRSDPATCYPGVVSETNALSGMLAFPLNPSAEPRFEAESRSLAQHCAQTSPDRFAHISTADVARDLDLLRRAVGDSKLNYAGYSYGTFLGATYAELFPNTIRAMVLDGTLDPRAYVGDEPRYRSVPGGIRIDQDQGGAEVYGQFLSLCAKAGPQVCSFAGLGNPTAVSRTMFDRLKQRPAVFHVPGGSTATVTYQVAVATVYDAMYSPSGWLDLADYLTTVARALQPGSANARVVSATVRRNAAGVAAAAATAARGEDYASVGGAIGSTCVDTRTPSPSVFPAAADRSDALYPEFGRYRTWTDLACYYLNQDGIHDADAYRGGWRQTTTTPVLVLGTLHDPATPYENTRPYASLFPKATVVTLDGWGHTTLGQSACTDAKVSYYLMDPTKPRTDVTCQPDTQPFTFTFASKAAATKAASRASVSAWLARAQR